MAVLKLAPAFKDYIWGGTRLRSEYGKKCGLERVAESWELSCHKDGPSVIADGADKGMQLNDYIAEHGSRILGTDCEKFGELPILIKLIDAKEKLSVQVHPDDEYAKRVEGENGKTEMWYVIDCEEGAELVYGFRREISRDEFAQRIKNNTLTEVTNNVPVRRGDVFFITAGTLHAIGKGILIAEIQQNSNTTYRVYDHGRVGADGKPRELHIDKALDVTKLTPSQPYKASPAEHCEGYVRRQLASCEYFTVLLIDTDDKINLHTDGRSFHSLLFLDGKAEISADNSDSSASTVIKAEKGDSVFITADTVGYTVKGKAQFLLTYV